MDYGALVGGGGAILAALLAWTQSRATNRRDDFKTMQAELRKDLDDERVQRKLLMSFVLDLFGWAQKVGPDTQAGPPPSPPEDLDLSPWRR